MQDSEPNVTEAGREWMVNEMSSKEYFGRVRAENAGRHYRAPKRRGRLREALVRLFGMADEPEPDENCTCGRPSCIMCDRDQ